MPGLGFSEMLFIFVAALLLFGPRRLPELGRTLGKGLAEFRRASSELRRTLDAEGLEKDLRETRETIRAVDPRRYVKEAMLSDEADDRAARTKRPERPARDRTAEPEQTNTETGGPEEDAGEKSADVGTPSEADESAAGRAPQNTVARGSQSAPRPSSSPQAAEAGEGASPAANSPAATAES